MLPLDSGAMLHKQHRHVRVMSPERIEQGRIAGTPSICVGSLGQQPSHYFGVAFPSGIVQRGLPFGILGVNASTTCQKTLDGIGSSKVGCRMNRHAPFVICENLHDLLMAQLHRYDCGRAAQFVLGVHFSSMSEKQRGYGLPPLLDGYLQRRAGIGIAPYVDVRAVSNKQFD